MGLLFIDGIDHYAIGDITKKWDNVTGTWYIEDTTPSPRFAYGKYIRCGTANYYLQKTFAAETTIVLGFAFQIDTMSTVQQVAVFGNTTNEQIGVYIATDGTISVYRMPSTLLASSIAGVISVDTWYYMEIKVLINGAAGTVDVWINEVNRVTGTGLDTHRDGSVEFTYIKLMSRTGNSYFDDIYIDDSTNHGDCRIDALLPDGAGNYTQFDPSAGANYECVDDPGDIDDDTTYVSTSTVNEIDTYDVDDLSTLAGSTIYGVALNNCVRKDDAGARKFRPLCRVNGSDYTGDEVDLTDSYVVSQYIWDDNPDDAAAWEEADIDGGEFGLKLTA